MSVKIFPGVQELKLSKSVAKTWHHKQKFFKRDLSSSMDKGAGSYLAGMAVAIPILNVDGRRHTNNFSKNI